MKMKALLALGLCFALTAPSLAQENEKKEVDSVSITPFDGVKIILVGKGMEQLLKENNFEVLKNKFIQDYREPAKDKDFPATAKNIIYMAGTDGRRRLKAVPDEVAPVDITTEINSFHNNLPPFHYTIYDLTKNYQYHIYANGPEDLNSLENTSVSSAIQSALAQSTYISKRLATLTTVSIGPSDSSYIFKGNSGYKSNWLLLSAFTGAGLLNGKFAPAYGVDLDIGFRNKYNRLKRRAGLTFSTFWLADYENKSFSNFYQLHNYNIHYMVNSSRSAKEYWLGFSAGLYSSGNLFGRSQGGSLNKAWQFGFVSQIGSFGVDFNFIKDRNKNENAAVLFRYYF